jgi:hypothetical protein
MSDLEPRRRAGMSRREREQRAYTLVLATGGLAVLTIVLVILAVVGAVGFGWALLAALLSIAAGYLVRRTTRP